MHAKSSLNVSVSVAAELIQVWKATASAAGLAPDEPLPGEAHVGHEPPFAASSAEPSAPKVASLSAVLGHTVPPRAHMRADIHSTACQADSLIARSPKNWPVGKPSMRSAASAEQRNFSSSSRTARIVGEPPKPRSAPMLVAASSSSSALVRLRGQSVGGLLTSLQVRLKSSTASLHPRFTPASTRSLPAYT